MKSSAEARLMKGSSPDIVLEEHWLVIDDISDNVTAVGVPAKAIKHHEIA